MSDEIQPTPDKTVEPEMEKTAGWRIRADQPSWWQRLLLWLSLPPLLLLLALVAVGPRFEQILRQTPHVAVPVHTGSTLGARHVASQGVTPTSVPLPTLPALVLATATPVPAVPPAATAATTTSAPSGGSATLTIACVSSTPGFCEFLQGAAIAQNAARCTLNLSVFAFVGQTTEPVSCTLSAAPGTFVGAGVPCYDDNKGSCIGKVATQHS